MADAGNDKKINIPEYMEHVNDTKLDRYSDAITPRTWVNVTINVGACSDLNQ